MAVETMKKVAVQYQLENGHDSEGNMQYITNSFQYIGKDGYDADKVLAVTDALKSVLAKTLSTVQSVKTAVISPNQ